MEPPYSEAVYRWFRDHDCQLLGTSNRGGAWLSCPTCGFHDASGCPLGDTGCWPRLTFLSDPARSFLRSLPWQSNGKGQNQGGKCQCLLHVSLVAPFVFAFICTILDDACRERVWKGQRIEALIHRLEWCLFSHLLSSSTDKGCKIHRVSCTFMFYLD